MTEDERHSFKDYFSEGSLHYAAYRPTYPPDVAAYLAGLCRRREFAWDCGCGSGQFSRLLAGQFDQVLATDASPSQLSQASQARGVEYRCAPAEDCGLAGQTVDLAVAAQAAHWFDLPAFYAEVTRVGREGAVIALITYGLLTVAGDVDEPIRSFYTEVLGTYWPPERRHVDQSYLSLDFPFQELAPPSFVMHREWTLAELFGYVRTWSAVRALVQSEGREPLEALEYEVARAWGDPARVRRVQWPLSMRVGRLD